MRGTIISAFYNSIPAALQSVVATMIKYTDNVGSSFDRSENVTPTSEKFSLASEFEIFATVTWANTYEQNYQQQYAYYKAGNSALKYQHNSTTTATHWWLRSPDNVSSDTSRWCVVRDTGLISYDAYKHRSRGFAPIFSIGSAA
jgi:hypothetical protein